MKYFLGIDPGQKGGISLIDKFGNLQEYSLMPPTVGDTHSLFCTWSLKYGISHNHHPVHVWMEKVGAMPKQGVVSMFNFGRGCGEMIGLCTAHWGAVSEVRPQEWKKVMLEGTDKSKDASIQVCENLFPHVNLVPKRCRKPSDGIAEAILIAEFGRRRML